MSHRALPTAAAVVLAAGLLLTACGGSSDDDAKPTDKVEGAEEAKSPSASASDSADKRPKIELPKDVDHVFEDQKTGDPAKDAVLADNAQAIMAMDAAIIDGEPASEGIQFYYEGEAAAATQKWVQGFLDNNISITGTIRYFAREVTLKGDDQASLVYCGDESKAFNKDRKTGEVDKSPTTNNSYVVYNAQLEKSDQGVWKTTRAISERGAEKCLP